MSQQNWTQGGDNLSEADQIRKEMAKIRLEMHQDVAGVVKNAESMLDWRSYIRNAPWVSMGAVHGTWVPDCPQKKVSASSQPGTSSLPGFHLQLEPGQHPRSFAFEKGPLDLDDWRHLVVAGGSYRDSSRSGLCR